MAQRLKAGGREFALLFTVEAMDNLEERLGEQITLQNLGDTIIQKLTDRHVLWAVVTELARQGEYAMGYRPDVDETWFKRNVKPGRQMQLHALVMEAMAEGLKMETSEGSENEEVDVVLEEIKKKREKTGSRRAG